jgi:hypothetical protein
MYAVVNTGFVFSNLGSHTTPEMRPRKVTQMVIFLRCSVGISAGLQIILTNALHGFTQSVEESVNVSD